MGTIVSVVFTVLVLSPAFSAPSDDSFPLSTFPMFSAPKPDPGLVVTQVLAVFSNGERKPVPPELATGNQEVIQALRMIYDQSYGGQERAQRFCRDIVARVKESPSPRWKEAVSIEIARSHFDTVAYFEVGPAPVTRKTLQRCPVTR